ncbi:Aminoglycoside 3-N-acetyltransferase [Natronobacterium gregoryi]|uniref:Aminoglycoside N3'-acetyltransferase n=2 Tax=Natronobacterium gregoryi TaxID=44930 RepID=L9Y481_NATGS|nr:aminoglycoside N3'-acetyltransferase [Natronobacterium gregoryi SP2]PLK19552.1 hypothetical protein CYV19_14035 [Natronobacterium gregoryi SP2]SFJ01075.1 Aminoglycoside 3-N-acetyltransferase [Natronobacterium gregoryi]
MTSTSRHQQSRWRLDGCDRDRIERERQTLPPQRGVEHSRLDVRRYRLGRASASGLVPEILHDLASDVLFLETSHATNTSVHLAEYRATIDLEVTDHASAVFVDGDRE